MKKLFTIYAIAGMLLVLSSTSKATIIGTFDGSAGYATFIDEYNAYRAFMGTPDDTITFEEFFSGGLNGPIGDYYLASKGVRFANEAGAVVLREGVYPMFGAWEQDDITGYDGSYQPDGTMVYDKPYNSNPASALTILCFTNPVSQIGSFIGDSYTSSSHTQTVSIYDSADNLLATVNPVIKAWDSGGYNTNAEGFWSVKCDTAQIAKITFVSPSNDWGFTTLDNIEFATSVPVPEPATIGILGLGALSLIRRKK